MVLIFHKPKFGYNQSEGRNCSPGNIIVGNRLHSQQISNRLFPTNFEQATPKKPRTGYPPTNFQQTTPSPLPTNFEQLAGTNYLFPA